MKTKELIEFLQKQEEKSVLLKLQGIITSTITIQKMKVKTKGKQLVLESQENEKQQIAFNISQLMKVTPVKENEILLEFDPLQNVTIILER